MGQHEDLPVNVRPSKRPRLIKPFPNCTASNVPHSSVIWYQDGNVVLQAQNSMQFRVHTSILSQNSPVLDDLFGFATPSSKLTTEGCPVVLMTDSAEDLEIFLKAIYIRGFFCEYDLQPLSVVGSILRLAEKYCVNDLYEQAVSCLTSEFPSTLAEYDINPDKFIKIRGYTGVHLDLIRLARQTGLLQVLPSVFYECILSYSLESIFFGIRDPSARVEPLSQNDQQCLVLAREKLFRATVDYTYRWLADLDCRNRACKAFRKEQLLELYSHESCFGALEPWIDAFGTKLCDFCRRHAPKIHKDGRAEVWSLLPSIIGLPPWEELLR